MYNLAVEIVRFVDDHQPGWVACEFVDAEGRQHALVDKVPIFGFDFLDGRSKYPQPGSVGCEVLSRSEDDKGRKLVRISTAKPFDIESREGLSEFVVLSAQLSVSQGLSA
ncbi:MAG TPA: hypothetical protein VJO16_22105 [Candidatus Acidoferrum sp.]|nr:hypothetical protein [Candidatus Acidoferrum sp.]